MNKAVIKNAILKRKISIFIIIILLILVWVLFAQKQDYKYTLFYQYQSIPDIELKNTLQDSQYGFLGEVSGFVKFDNIQDQPRDLRQYYVIKPINRFDQDLSQHFSIEEIIKMQYLSPKSIGTSELILVNKTDNIATLEDENGNQYFFNRVTREISMRDAVGDNISLITKDSDYKDFMISWLLKK